MDVGDSIDFEIGKEDQFTSSEKESVAVIKPEFNYNKSRRISSAKSAKELRLSGIERKKEKESVTRSQVISDIKTLKVSMDELQKQVDDDNKEQEEILEMIALLSRRVNEIEVLIDASYEQPPADDAQNEDISDV